MMKKVLLIDVDSKIPNLALMKFSFYLKRKKEISIIDGIEYNLIYISTISAIDHIS